MASSRLAVLLVLLLATIQVVLAQIDGDFLIISAKRFGPPPSPIGFDPYRRGATPVVIGGSQAIWNIRKAGGEGDLYTIESQADGRTYELRPDGDKVVADPFSPPFLWQIQQVERSFVIQTPSNTWSNSALAVSKSYPGSPVELKSYEGEPTSELLWDLVRDESYMRPKERGCRQYPLAY